MGYINTPRKFGYYYGKNLNMEKFDGYYINYYFITHFGMVKY